MPKHVRVKSRYFTLYGLYEPKYFYFEIAQMIQRLFFFSALTLLNGLGVFQALLAVFVNISWLLLISNTAPLHRNSDDLLEQSTVVNHMYILLFVIVLEFREYSGDVISGPMLIVAQLVFLGLQSSLAFPFCLAFFTMLFPRNKKVKAKMQIEARAMLHG